MRKSFLICLDKNIARDTENNLEQFFEELKNYNGVEIDKNKLEITYDTSIENEVGKLLDKHILKIQNNG